MNTFKRLALALTLGCCVLALALAPGSAAAAAPTGTQVPALAADPLYQATPISSAVRTIVLCKCPGQPCSQHGQGGQVCGGDPEIFCPICHCVVAVDGTHYCAETP